VHGDDAKGDQLPGEGEDQALVAFLRRLGNEVLDDPRRGLVEDAGRLAVGVAANDPPAGSAVVRSIPATSRAAPLTQSEW